MLRLHFSYDFDGEVAACAVAVQVRRNVGYKVGGTCVLYVSSLVGHIRGQRRVRRVGVTIASWDTFNEFVDGCGSGYTSHHIGITRYVYRRARGSKKRRLNVITTGLP